MMFFVVTACVFTAMLVVMFGYLFVKFRKLPSTKNFALKVLKKAIPWWMADVCVTALAVSLTAVFVAMETAGYVLTAGMVAFAVIGLLISSVESKKNKESADNYYIKPFLR